MDEHKETLEQTAQEVPAQESAAQENAPEDKTPAELPRGLRPMDRVIFVLAAATAWASWPPACTGS